MKDVTLTIRGHHMHEDAEDDTIEFVTDGKMYERNGKIYLFYDEGKMSGLEGLQTRLKISGDTISMTRSGKSVAVDTEIKFEKGKRYKGFYDTDFGPIEMEVLTNEIKNSVTKKGDGKIEIDYNISFKGLTEGRSKMNIEVRS